MNIENKLRVCVPVCASTITAAKEALARACTVADIVELRLDCLLPAELERATELRPLLASLNIPVIVTLRPREQGGSSDLDLAARSRFWTSWSDPDLFYDLELDLLEVGQWPKKTKSHHLICSHHYFSAVPVDLEAIYDRMLATPARILKVAVQAQDVTDCIPMFQLLARARQQQREMIPIAMGPAGIATRILGPARGAFLTYAALDQKSATAAGQPTATELKSLYRIDTINQETQITGLMGLPVLHSVSPQMHNAALKAADLNGVYLPFPVRDATEFLRRMVHPRTREMDWNIRGVSVTAPYKSTVIDALDWIEPTAAELGAINTIVVEGDQLRGYNTDILAFIQTLVASFGELPNAKCAVIGAGGAARAVIWGLKQTTTDVTVFGRNELQAKTLARELEVDYRSFGEARFDEFDLVINATTLGTAGELESQTPARAAQLAGARLACDLVYNPEETLFLREARAAGCQTLGGLPMLVRQAIAQFKLWTGIEAGEKVMLQAAQQALVAGTR
jgi:3-dehydroquinate dehydratase / shikimate dehydrogenase